MAETEELRLKRLKEHDQRMSRIFDEVMGLGDFADSSRGSGSSSKSGQDESKVVEKDQPPGEEDSNCSRREEKMEEDADEMFPSIASFSSEPSFTAGASAGSGGAALDNAMDAPPPCGVEDEDEDDWDFTFPIKSSQSKGEKSETQSETFAGDSREAADNEGSSSTTSPSSAPREDENTREVAERSSETDDSQQEPPQTAPTENTSVAPLSPNVNIKEEPIDEEYDAALLPQNSIKDIKEELEHQEEELRISSVFSVGGSSAFAHPSVAPPAPPVPPIPPVPAPTQAPTQAPVTTTFFLPGRGTMLQAMAPLSVRPPVPVLNTIPTATPMPPRPSPPTVPGGVRCSGCSKILMKGQTAFQRKGSTQLFCSTVCLTGHLPVVSKTRTCFQCYKDIVNPREMVTMSGENSTLMNFCGQFCLSVYKSKRRQTGTETEKRVEQIQNTLPEKPTCSVCKVTGKIEHEVTHQGSLHRLCSDACFVTWRKLKQLALNCCDGCGLYCNSNSDSCQTLMVDKSVLNFCGPTCISTYKQTCRKTAECACCHKVVVVSSTIMEVDQKGKVQLYCSTFCVEKSRPPKHTLSDAAFPCSHCKVVAVPQYHLAMVDGTIRNFCSLDCVTTYRKSSQSNLTNGTSKNLPVKDRPGQVASKESISASKDPTPVKKDPFYSPVVSSAPQKSEIPPAVEPGPRVTKTDLHAIRLSCHYCKEQFRSKPQLMSHQGGISIFCSNACRFEYKTRKNILASCVHCKQEKLLHEKISNNEEEVTFCSEGCKRLYKNEHLSNPPCSYCSRFSSKMLQSHYCGQMEDFCKPYCMSKYTVRYYGMARCDSCRTQGPMTENLQLLGSVRNFCNLSCLLQYCYMHFDKGKHSISNGTGPEPPKLNGAPAQRDKNNMNLNHACTQTVGSHVPMPRRRPMKNKSILCRPITMDQEISCQLPCPPETAGVVPPLSAPKEEDKVKYVMVPVPVPVFIPVPMNMYSQHTPVPMAMPLPVPVPMVVPPQKNKMKDAAVQFEEVPTKDETFLSDTDENGNGEKSEPHSSSISPVIDNINENEESTTSDSPVTNSEFDHPSSPVMDLERDFPFALDQKGLARRGVKRKRPQSETASGGGNAVVSPPIKLNYLYGINAWKSWVRQRNKKQPVENPMHIQEDVLQCDSTQLSSALCHFIREVQRPNGDTYSPDSIFYLCLSIQQYLFMEGRIENIFNDRLYGQFASDITDMLTHWKPSPAHCGGVVSSRIEESFLWECKHLGAYSPLVLLNTLLFFFTKHFGLLTGDEHAGLSFTDISLCSKPCSRVGRVSYLHFTKSRVLTQEHTEAEEETIELLENGSNPLHCPVRLYEFYLSRCPDVANRRWGLFYLQPEQNVHTDSIVWYTCQPLDQNTLQSMLTRILAVKESSVPELVSNGGGLSYEDVRRGTVFQDILEGLQCGHVPQLTQRLDVFLLSS